MYIYIAVVLTILFIIQFVLSITLHSKSPDTFPDAKFSETCKKYGTKEIANNLDEKVNEI